MRKYQNIAVLAGGWSAEREVSLVSGRECAAGLRAAGYRVAEVDAGYDLAQELAALRPDAVFNALHGRWGEDGAVQGVLECLHLPYTHSGVLASALAMDKVRAKQLFAAAGLRVPHGVLKTPADIAAGHVLQPPYVVKPHNEGSSVGIRIVQGSANTPPDVADAEGPTLLVEEFIPGRELTVAVMHERPLAVTEIIAPGWYDFHAKYAEGGSRHVVPADLPQAVIGAALEMALSAHNALGCRGLTRADFRFNEAAGNSPEQLVILELNTQPGMTPTSLAPEQATYCGISFSELVAWIAEDASCNR